MTTKPYKVINGGNTYRLITPDEARALLDSPGSETHVYAIHAPEVVERYNAEFGKDGIPIKHVERLQASCDVDLFIREFGTEQFAIRVGKIGDILLHMDE